MTTVRCKACNTTLTSKHAYDYQTCPCENKTHVCGELIGAFDLSLVEQIRQPKEQKDLRVGKEAQRKRTTKLSDVEFK
jgi:hypothetical protein